MKNFKTKKYHLGDILSITTGRLVSLRHIDGVYDILNFMTNDNLFTHQLGRASQECKPELLKQHPKLKDIDTSKCNSETWEDWLQEQIEKFGEELSVKPIRTKRHTYKNPITEAVQMKKDIICITSRSTLTSA